MARIEPFKGIMFNKSDKLNFGDYLCPPFDVIDDNLKSKLYDTSEFNVIRLENGKIFEDDDEVSNKYNRAKDLFKLWLKEGKLLESEEDCFYILEETYLNLGKSQSRRSLIAVVVLHEYSEKIIFPHEKTRKKQKQDRLKLLSSTRANFSPIMSFIEDKNYDLLTFLSDTIEGAEIAQGSIPEMHDFRLWKITDKDKIFFLQDLIDHEDIFIADGHHRYETAVTFSKIEPSLPKFRIMNLISLNDPGLLMLGYHRALSGIDSIKMNLIENELKSRFEVTKTNWENSFINWHHYDKNQILLMTKGKFLILTAKDPDKSSYEVLNEVFEDNFTQDELISHLTYNHDSKSIIGKIESNEYQAGFLMNALSKDYFLDTVSKGILLPPKSTFFYPKLPTGLVIQYLK